MSYRFAQDVIKNRIPQRFTSLPNDQEATVPTNGVRLSCASETCPPWGEHTQHRLLVEAAFVLDDDCHDCRIRTRGPNGVDHFEHEGGLAAQETTRASPASFSRPNCEPARQPSADNFSNEGRPGGVRHAERWPHVPAEIEPFRYDRLRPPGLECRCARRDEQYKRDEPTPSNDH